MDRTSNLNWKQLPTKKNSCIATYLPSHKPCKKGASELTMNYCLDVSVRLALNNILSLYNILVMDRTSNLNWKQLPTKKRLYRHLPPIS